MDRPPGKVGVFILRYPSSVLFQDELPEASSVKISTIYIGTYVN